MPLYFTANIRHGKQNTIFTAVLSDMKVPLKNTLKLAQSLNPTGIPMLT